MRPKLLGKPSRTRVIHHVRTLIAEWAADQLGSAADSPPLWHGLRPCHNGARFHLDGHLRPNRQCEISWRTFPEFWSFSESSGNVQPLGDCGQAADLLPCQHVTVARQSALLRPPVQQKWVSLAPLLGAMRSSSLMSWKRRFFSSLQAPGAFLYSSLRGSMGTSLPWSS